MKTPLIFIRHRVNNLIDLKRVAPENGVEIDIRSDVHRRGALHLSHDPWTIGTPFLTWLRVYKKRGIQGPLILNTKEDGLEEKIESHLASLGITNYFYLDTAFPTLVNWAIHRNSPHFAPRLSSHESRETVERFRGKSEWLWVDCFGGKPVDKKLLQHLKPFKICLVSPELQGKPAETIPLFYRLAPLADAVCTKRPDLWKKAIRPI